MANPYIHWDQREERRKWARDLLARYGAGLVRSTADFYRPAILSDKAQAREVRGLRRRSRRLILESLGQKSLFS